MNRSPRWTNRTLLLCLSCLAACGPGVRPLSEAPVYEVEPGASAPALPGVQAGYIITANIGRSFRLVWTGDSTQSGAYRRFTGIVTAQGGIVSMTPGCDGNSCRLEAGDTLTAPSRDGSGESFQFDTIASDGIDGVDFVTGAGTVYFDLLIDGGRYPELVSMPSPAAAGQAVSVASIPFGVIPPR